MTLIPIHGNRSYEGLLTGVHGNETFDILGTVSETTAKTVCSMLGFGYVIIYLLNTLIREQGSPQET